MAEKETPVPFEFQPHYEHAIEDIAESSVDLIEAIRDKHIDTIIFTDKSARPLSWVFMRAWRELYPNERSPEIRFLNIGAEKTPSDFPDIITKPLPTSEKIKKYAAEAIEQFRIDKQLKKLYQGRGFEKGKRIIVVEEQVGTGLSCQIVKQGLERAFPKSRVTLFDAEITHLGWRFPHIAGIKDKERKFGEQYGKDYSEALIGVSEGTEESVQTRPYYKETSDVRSEKINFGNVVEGKIWRPHHYLRKDLKRAAEKTVELMRSDDRSWRED